MEGKKKFHFPNVFAGAFPEHQTKEQSCCTGSSTALPDAGGAMGPPGLQSEPQNWGAGRLGHLWVTGNCDSRVQLL